MDMLEEVKDFRGLKGLTGPELELLCAEIRKRILAVTLKNGGHLSSSLGAVELNVALLRAFDPDADKIIFDVGHQAYAYKILTKRMDRFNTLRTKGGLAGFPRMDESPYDFFIGGHSSTSISAALGYARARDLEGKKHNVVAVIGDGALLNGVAFEGLNAIQSTKSKIIIVLNDNKMSISPRVGGMAGHLARLSVNNSYRRFKNFVKDQCRKMNRGEAVEELLGNIKTKLKSLLLPTNIFEELDISYWGPFNGHSVTEMEEVFNLAKGYDRSLLIHVLTQKGRGYVETEAHPSFFHGVGPGTKLSAADAPAASKGAPGWSAVMSDALTKLAHDDKRVIACTAAMKDGTKLGSFAAAYPDRFFDVGICEEHMLTFAAGMAAGGLRPAVCVYSTFMQRAADQITQDICMQKLPVLLGVDRAGLVGEDGETHNGIFDMAWLRDIPNITLAAPRDAADLKFFVNEWLERSIPMAVRYPRGKAELSLARADGGLPAEWGRLEVLRSGARVCLIGVGSTVRLMLEAADLLKQNGAGEATVVDLRFIKPLDADGLEPLLKAHGLVITAEEGCVTGGIGSAIGAFAMSRGFGCRVISVGVPDRFISHEKRSEQWEECGLTPEHIVSLCDKR